MKHDWKKLYPFAGRRMDLGGYEMHYLDEGKGETVVMVHGNPTWSFYYRNVIKALRPHYRCLVPDHIGMGLSDKPDGYNYTLSMRIDDLERLIEHAAPHGPVTLILHDWGGMIGMGWAVRHPERVARIVAMNTACFGLPPGTPFPWPLTVARTRLGGLLIRGGNAFVRAAAKTCVVRKPLPPDVRAGYLAPYGNWSDRIATLRFVQDIPLSRIDPAWSHVASIDENLHTLRDVPMFLPWGMKDWVFGAAFLNGWIKRFPKAEVKRFPDCGHYLLEDAPELVPLIAEFLAQPKRKAAA